MFSALSEGYCSWCRRLYCYWFQASGNRQVILVWEAFIKICCVTLQEILLLNSYVSRVTGTKLSEDSRKYGAENTCTSGNTLSRAALSFAQARAQAEKERGNLLKALGTQVLYMY